MRISSFLSRVPVLKAEVNGWLSNWPAGTREALRQRVFHANPDTVYPALLELYVHEILRNRFSEVLYEPTLQNTTHRPEFVARDTEISIIVECKVAFDEQRVRFSSNELRRLVNFLNRLQTDYGITVQPHGRLAAQVTPRRIVAFLKRELSKLTTPVEVGHTLVFHDLSTETSINFILMGPQDPDTNTVVSWWPTGDIAQTVTTHERIRAAVDEKATRYGELSEPFLIVVYPETEFPDSKEAIMRALYGDDQVQINFVNKQGVWSRALNGAFTRVSGSGKPLCTRVSAVGVYRLRFSSEDDYEHRFAIFHNPYADHPLDPTVFREIPQFVVQSSGGADLTLGWFEDGSPDWWKNV